ncbi:helix-turn-helix domain-containing protein [Curtobacterium sp. MCLR17_007]|uniref:helix-turn-helix domain-containing protein n=1 Tax=Curtobacterium sp. MCLR17_007 TaxID=2175648 RepID=UPI000DAA03D2|nr:helix-turn-helix domain-containing protein [Curtobacterium sp. MCLR17_007]WIB61498.1 helix-turn-helix domain-containing protein [Curtobacterium sp. MCLR17_007]
MRISDDPPHPPTATADPATRPTSPTAGASKEASKEASTGAASGSATSTGTVQTVEKTLAILEVVADRGGATAKEVAEATGFPLPTAYRLLHALVSADYLVHLRDQRRFELGDKLRALGALAVPRPSTG